MVDSHFLSINSLTRKESLKNLARITFLRTQRSNPAQVIRRIIDLVVIFHTKTYLYVIIFNI